MVVTHISSNHCLAYSALSDCMCVCECLKKVLLASGIRYGGPPGKHTYYS